MKRILSWLLALMLILSIAGCNATDPIQPTTNTPSISGPTASTSPSSPTVDSTDTPTEPVTEPTDSTQATQPDGTTPPSQPSESTTPTQPSGSTTQPTNPPATQPSGSTTPTQPNETTSPTQPTENPPVTQPTTPPVTQPTTPPVTDPNLGTASSLEVHYIDVGQADCILLECAGEYMLIDGGNVADSSLVVSYLDRVGVEELEIVVNTHPHEDHVGGLAGVLAVFPTHAVYSPTRTHSSNCFDNFVKYVDQQRLTIQIPSPGDTMTLGDANITVLGPVKSYSDVNNTSIVLMVTLGQTRFLFTGDMGTTAENDMLEYWDDRFDFRADVLKVGHHGSEDASGYRFLYYVNPQYGVISVGANNSYGHPHEAALSRLHDADVSVYRTSEMGTIVATSDGTNISFAWEKSNSQPSLPDSGSTTPTQPAPTDPPATEPSGIQYIGTKSTKKFHLPTCRYVPKEDNRAYFDSWQAAIDAGYVACKVCEP